MKSRLVLLCVLALVLVATVSVKRKGGAERQHNRPKAFRPCSGKDLTGWQGAIPAKKTREDSR